MCRMEQMEFKWTGKKYSLSLLQIFFGVLIIGGLAFWGGSSAKGWVPFAGMTPVYDTRAPDNVDLAPLFAAWHLLDNNFVSATTTKVTAEEKLYGAIAGLAHAYGDDYTVFFPPAEKTNFDTQVRGDFEGVGMEIGKQNGILTVIAPIKGTPAYKAGIKSGDFVLKIDGISTADMTADEAVTHIRGKKGTSVTLTISRTDKDKGKEFDVSVTRDTISLPTLDTTARPDGVFVIALYSFNAQSPELFSAAIQEFNRTGDTKLIIDLRGNPGGYLEAAVDMASWLLPEGDTVVIQDYGTKQEKVTYKSNGFGTLQAKNVKTAILIDRGSASAAEIFAGALHDHNRATLVGETSFGKGSVQQLFDVTKDTSLKITIARWLTPNGISISHKGIDPDIKAANPTDAERTAGKDPQLDRAVQFLQSGK
jgi:carboxyl-terminal processing protease